DELDNPLYRRLPLPQRQIAFMHVPKCGGTAVATYLREQMGGCRLVNNLPVLQSLGGEDVRSIDLIHEHFSMDDTAIFDPHCFLFSIVRDPVDRMMSQYYSIRAGQSGLEEAFPALVEACNSLSFADFIEAADDDLTVWTRNAMARQFAGNHLAPFS